MRKQFLGLLLAVACAVPALLPNNSAYANPTFTPEFLISDNNLRETTNPMTVAEIQAFLDKKGSSCTSSDCLRKKIFHIQGKNADKYCGKITEAKNIKASEIIYRVAKACNISPTFILVTLQKENSLITTEPWKSGTRNAYQTAMGFACPDDSPCRSEFFGLGEQIYRAARQLHVYRLYPEEFNFAAGRKSYLQYYPNKSCGGTNVNVKNWATASLYNYTPYQPNPALLAGKPDKCSTYGNYNFFYMYNAWFGDPRVDRKVSGWFTEAGVKKYKQADGTIAKGWFKQTEGTYYLDPNTGAMVTGWKQIGDYKYYFTSKGLLVTGAQTVSGKLYYFDSKGVIQTGWFNFAGKKHYANGDGTVNKQWVKTADKWYYVDANGVMAVGIQTIDSKLYYFSTEANTLGQRQSGWHTVEGKKYYFGAINGLAVEKVTFADSQASEINVTTESGTAPLLPLKAKVVWSGGEVTQPEIKWPTDEKYKQSDGTQYTLRATVEGHDLVAKVTISSAKAQSVVESQPVYTTKEVSPILPQTVTVLWSNGKKTEESVTWSRIDESSLAQTGDFMVTGKTIANLEAKIKVVVLPNKVVSVQKIETLTTESGVDPSAKLPAEVSVKIDNNKTMLMPVKWTPNQSYKLREGGTYNIVGKIDTWDGEVIQPVKVNPAVVTSVEVTGQNGTVFEITTDAGQPPALPYEAKLLWSNAEQTTEKITWPADERYQNYLGDKYDLSTMVAGQTIVAHIMVRPAALQTVKELSPVQTYVGQAPQIPTQAVLVWSNGQESKAEIQWEEVPAKLYAIPAIFEVSGKVKSRQIIVKVVVKAKPAENRYQPQLLSLGNKVKVGQDVLINAKGFKPNATVQVILHSEPITLAIFTTTADGSLSGRVIIPANTATGEHTLVLRQNLGEQVINVEHKLMVEAADNRALKVSSNTPAFTANSITPQNKSTIADMHPRNIAPVHKYTAEELANTGASLSFIMLLGVLTLVSAGGVIVVWIRLRYRK